MKNPNHADEIDYLLDLAEANDVIITVADLEARGWKTWLLTLCPFAFEEDFSADHIKFWTLYWSVLQRIRLQQYHFSQRDINPYERDESKIKEFFESKGCWIGEDEYALLLILARGLAKSSTIEAAGMMRGCLLGGYLLYVCESQDQADEHLSNVKNLIDSPDSRVTEFYPHMRIDPEARWRDKKIMNRTDMFITQNGAFIGRAKGLNASLRGIRVGNFRPDCVCIDDIDGVNDSLAVTEKKLDQLAGSVIPTQARKWATILAGQNLIGETTVFNKIYTGKSDVLAARTTIGVTNAFERFEENREYISYLDEETGRIRHKILPTAIPTWSGLNIAAAQKFLNDSGLPTFLAEYMNSFEHQKTGKVFREYNEERHLVTWDEFESVMGVRHIPGHWRAKAAADFGYSDKSLSAWLFVARSAQNAAIPGLYFGYRSMTFMYDTIGDQAIEIWQKLFPHRESGKMHFEAMQSFADYPELFRALNLRPECSEFLKNFTYDHFQNKFTLKPLDYERAKNLSEEDKALFYVQNAERTFKSQIGSWVVSHEKTGEQRTLAQMYGIPAAKVTRFGADAGVAESNELLRGDYTQPHPFQPDEIVPETGLYRLGRPYLYFLVERKEAPRGDEDFKTFRDHVSGQRWTEEKLTDLGLSKQVPMKVNSDHCDALRMFAVDYHMPASTPKTREEWVQEQIPERYKHREGVRNTPEFEMSAKMARAFAEERIRAEFGDDDE